MIIMAVTNLIDFSTMQNAWRANKDDGIAAILTFVATIAFAPNIQNGVLTGIIFSLGAFIYRRMFPQIVLMGRHADGTLRDAEFHKLPPPHEKIGALRFDAALFFANVSFFEDAILRLERENPNLEYILVMANGINHLDASAVEMLRALTRHLRECGITLAFSGTKRQCLDVAERTGLIKEIGRENIFSSDDLALKTLITRIDAHATKP